jgi:menaquinone-9 beta-reductase
METIDLVIVGSGPAGISTALHLLKQDASWAGRMLLIERDVHPRPKLCGGGVTRLGLKLLQDLGFDLPLPIPQARVDDVRLVYGDRTIHVRGRPQFLVFHRADFDAYLAREARRAGADIRENEAVQKMDVDETGVTIWTSKGSYRSLMVVGADGAKGIARRSLHTHDTPTRVARLLEILHPAGPSAPHFLDRFALFDFTPVEDDLQGYYWEFPAYVNGRTHFNRGVFDARIIRDQPRANLKRVLQVSMQVGGTTGEPGEIAGHPIHWFSPRNRFSAPRLLLVGDAAGADPLFGEGIGPALAYGKLAAESIRNAAQTGDYAFRDYRPRLVNSYLGRYLMFHWTVAKICYRWSSHKLFMRALWSVGKLLASVWPEPEINFKDGIMQESQHLK